MYGRITLMAAMAVASAAAWAFEEIPWASAKALGVTRGKQFSAGLVFVNGKYVEPPYVVERWGTGIRINSIPVTGQVIDWSDFVKTQDPANVVKTMPEPSAPAPVQMYVPEIEPKSDADALDDLFDDNPTPKKPASSWSASSRRVVQPRPRPPSPKYELVGKFVKNDASKALIRRINDQRTEIDGILRRGGFIFFGDGYSRVVGDSRTVETMLATLPETMQRSEELGAFRAAIRADGMLYVNEILSGQLFANKIDYRRLQERRKKLKSEQEWNRLLKDVNKPLL